MSIRPLIKKRLAELQNIALEFNERNLALILSAVECSIDEDTDDKLVTHLIEFMSETHER